MIHNTFVETVSKSENRILGVESYISIETRTLTVKTKETGFPGKSGYKSNISWSIQCL